MGYAIRTFLLMVVFAAMCSVVFGAPPDKWAKTFGGGTNESGHAVIRTSDGGSLLAGSTWSFPAETGYENAWLIKLDPFGQVQWEKTYGEDLWDNILSIEQTSDGGYIAAGSRVAPGTTQDAWAMKLAANGDIEWQRRYGRDDYFEGAHVILQTADAGYLLLCWTYPYKYGTTQGAWLLKLHSDGTVAWQSFFGGDLYDTMFDLMPTEDGGYLLAGSSFSYAEAVWGSDVWAIKISALGQVQWERTYGGLYSDVAYSISPAPDGGAYLVCYGGSFLGSTWILRIDSDGEVLWQKSYGTSEPRDSLPTPGGGLVVVGALLGPAENGGMAFEVDAHGEVLWQSRIGGNWDIFTSIAKTRSGYLLTGKTFSFRPEGTAIWAVNISGGGKLLWSNFTTRTAFAAQDTHSRQWLIDAAPWSLDAPATPSHVTAHDTQALITEINPKPGANHGKPKALPLWIGAEHCIDWPYAPGLRKADKCGISPLHLSIFE